ncbi:MAG: oligosaccharide flippase family protein [Gammaproteobacteria bacterium]|nr:oligosaccharide flippase family protein [Gammaproteobacteria bacterium]
MHKKRLSLTLKKVATGTATIYAIGIVLTLMSQIILTNILGSHQYSIYYYVLTWLFILTIISKFGIDILLLRFIPKYNIKCEWQFFKGIIFWSKKNILKTSLSISSLYLLTVFLFRNNLEQELTNTFYIGCLAIPLLTSIYIRYGILKGLKHPNLSLLPELIISPIILSLFVLITEYFFNRTNTASLTMLYYVITLIIGSLLGQQWLKKRLPTEIHHVNPNYKSRYWLQITFPLFIITLLHQLLGNNDTILLGLINGTKNIGIYGIASKLSLAVSFPLIVANVLFAPIISECYSTNNINGLQHKLNKGMRFVIFSSIIFFTSLIFFREQVLTIFGKDFLQGSTSLVILSIGQIINAILGPVGFLLSQTSYEKTVMKTLFLAVLLNIILNLLLIPDYGIEGAALATSISIISWNVILYYKVRQYLGIDASGLFKIRIT